MKKENKKLGEFNSREEKIEKSLTAFKRKYIFWLFKITLIILATVSDNLIYSHFIKINNFELF